MLQNWLQSQGEPMLQVPAGGVRGPSTVAQGATLEVEVGSGVGTIYVGSVGSPDRKSYPVGADGKARIPTAGFTAGAMIIVATASHGRFESIFVEVIGTE